MSIKYGLAKVQFIACYSEIIDLIEKGYTTKNIYDKFIELKKITMSYRAFTRYIHLRIKNTVEESSNIKQATKKAIQERQQDKKQEQEKPKVEEKPQEKPVRVFSTPEKKKGFGSGLHRDADEVC